MNSRINLLVQRRSSPFRLVVYTLNRIAYLAMIAFIILLLGSAICLARSLVEISETLAQLSLFCVIIGVTAEVVCVVLERIKSGA